MWVTKIEKMLLDGVKVNTEIDEGEPRTRDYPGAAGVVRFEYRYEVSERDFNTLLGEIIAGKGEVVSELDYLDSVQTYIRNFWEGYDEATEEEKINYEWTIENKEIMREYLQHDIGVLVGDGEICKEYMEEDILGKEPYFLVEDRQHTIENYNVATEVETYTGGIIITVIYKL